MEDIENQDSENQLVKRPTFLVVLSVLSLIVIGFGLIATISSLFVGQMSEEQMDELLAQGMTSVNTLNDSGSESLANLMEKTLVMQRYINDNFYVNALISIGSFVIGLIGVIFMLKARKKGFHLYIIYNIISVLAVYASVPVSEVPSIFLILNVILSALFIFLYSRNLHYMKAA